MVPKLLLLFVILSWHTFGGSKPYKNQDFFKHGKEGLLHKGGEIDGYEYPQGSKIYTTKGGITEVMFARPAKMASIESGGGVITEHETTLLGQSSVTEIHSHYPDGRIYKMIWSWVAVCNSNTWFICKNQNRFFERKRSEKWKLI